MVSHDLCNSHSVDKQSYFIRAQSIPLWKALQVLYCMFCPETFRQFHFSRELARHCLCLTMMYLLLIWRTNRTQAARPAQRERPDKDLSLPSSSINTWESVAACSLEEWPTSAVGVYSEACLCLQSVGGGGVCGSTTGRLFQVSPAKFKWLGPSAAPLPMGSVSARAANLCERRDCWCQRGDSVFYKHMQALRRKKKKKKLWQGRMYICRCLPGGGLQSLLQWWPFDVPSSSHDATLWRVRGDYFCDL